MSFRWGYRVASLVTAMSLFLPSQALADIVLQPIQPIFSRVTSLPTWLDFGAGYNTALFSTSNTVTLSGSQYFNNSFGYRIGTAIDSNPAIGLTFQGADQGAYNYSAPYNISYLAPDKVLAGQSYSIKPYLEIKGAPTLSVNSSNLQYGTFFDFSIDPPLISEINVNWAIPNYTIPPLSITAQGAGLINTTGTTYFDRTADWGPGYFTMSTNQGSMDAWAASVDLITLGSVLGVPGLNVVDTLGFDLNLGVGMPILRSDAFGMSNYFFSNPGLINVGSGLATGSTFSTLVTATLEYDLLFQSVYYYDLDILLEFDGPFFDPLVWDQDVTDPFLVKIVNSVLRTSQSVTFEYVAEVADSNVCKFNVVTGGMICFEPAEVDLFSGLVVGDFADPSLTPGLVQSDLPFPAFTPSQMAAWEAQMQAVPEPSSLALLSLSLAGLGFIGRRASLISP